jgi:hypothetical protein
MNDVKFCKLSRLRRAGHVVRQGDDDLARTVLIGEPGGKNPRGTPRLRWEDGVEEGVAKLGCRNWTVAAWTGKDGGNSWRRLRTILGCSAVGERERGWRWDDTENEIPKYVLWYNKSFPSATPSTTNPTWNTVEPLLSGLMTGCRWPDNKKSPVNVPVRVC